MRVQNIQNQNFGKKAVMTCKIVKSDTKEKTPATLWRYNANDYKDQAEIRDNDRIPQRVREEFWRYFDLYGSSVNFYVLKDGNSFETISYAQTSQHYRESDSEIQGYYTQIDEFGTNPNYINSIEPVVAQIINEAEDKCSTSVVITPNEDEFSLLKNIRFSKTKQGEFFIPEKRFDSIVDKAQERSRMKFWA